MLHTIKLSRLCAGMVAALSATMAHAEWVFNLQTPQTEIARQIYDLHTQMLVVCVVIFVAVFGVMFYSVFKHRKSVGHKAANFHESAAVEVAWTVIPFLILFVMAIPATRTILAQKDTRGADMTIKVTGYQWKWGYDYVDDGIGFFSNLATPRDQIENRADKGKYYLLEVDHPLVVPVGKKIHIIGTAADVIHSWWVPEFGVKQDVIPGMIRHTWFKAEKPGMYRGVCAELCGKEHGFMPIVVEVKSEADYAIWLAAEKKREGVGDDGKSAVVQDDPKKVWDMAGLKARGHDVFMTNCSGCHGPEGKGNPGVAPALDGSKIVNTDKAAHIKLVLTGRKGLIGQMPSWNQLSDTEIAAVITYERNSWGNHTGEVVQPSDVKAARQ